jgi:hypothetical protein
MRALVKLMIVGILVFWVGPSTWHRLSVANRVEINGLVKNLQDEVNQLISSIEQASSGATSASTSGPPYQPAQETTLMQPGLWSFNATETIGGPTMTASGTQCVTPEKVAEMTTGNGFITGGNCQVQGGRQGNQVFASGQCVIGNMSMQVTVQMTFDRPQHVHGQMSGGAGGAQGFAATVDGHWVGGC